MYYRIDAVDSWFFRNAAPFDAGLNTEGESIFPPFPSVYAGALRNCAVPIPSSDNNKSNTFKRRLKIGWNGVIANNQILFPLPLDLYITESKEKKFTANEMILSSSEGSSFPLPYFLKSPEDSKKPPHISGGAYFTESEMNKYLNAESCDYSVCPLGDYISKETRIGISIDAATGTAAEGLYYQQTAVTPEKILPGGKIQQCSLAIEASGIETPEKAVVRIGGDGKLGVISCIDDLPIPDAPMIENDKHFKIYLATPAIFEKGWLPRWIGEDMTGIFSYKKHCVRIQLFSAVVGRPVAVGGFGYYEDIKDNEDKSTPGKTIFSPKEMRYAVPAGSVYYFKLLDGSMKDVMYLFHKRCISDYREGLGFYYENSEENKLIKTKYDRLQYCSRGFGYSLVGSISKEQRGEFDDVQ